MLKFDNILDFSKKEIDVFAIGELLVDMISTEYDDLNASTYSKYFGGSPANIAMNISRLGANATIFSCVGKDNLGDFLINHLKNSQINTEYIKLDQLLKFASAVEGGGMAKNVIIDGLVKVNGEICLQRGKKLRDKDIVEFNNEKYIISIDEKW